MSLEPQIAGLVLLGAVGHAIWNALVKSSSDRLLTQSLVIGTGAVMAIPAIFLTNFPAPASWPYLILSVLIHNLYFFCLLRAYHWGDLSQVYPIARGSAPMLVALFSALFVGERLGPIAVVGVALVSAGILSLAVSRQMFRRDALRPVLFAIGTGITISCYTLCDGLGVRLSGDRLGFIAWLLFLSPLPLVVTTVIRRGPKLRGLLRIHWAHGVGAGVVATLGYGVAIWALSLGAMAHVSSLRETSVIMGALIGAFVLGEPFGLRRIAAAAAVAGGVVLLSVGA